MKIFRIFGAVTNEKESRCDTCTSARIVRGYVAVEKISFCNRAAEAVRIPFAVSECSDYFDKRVPFNGPERKVGFSAAVGDEKSAEQVA
jgi:hypothetical protein